MLTGCGRKIGPYDCCTVVCGDCLELMKALPDGCVDAVITDPPYGVGFSYISHNDSRTSYEASLQKWQSAIFSLKCWGVCVTPGIDNCCLWPQPRWILCWLKSNSMGPNRLSGPGTVSRNLWEPILWYGSYPKHPPSRDILHAPLGVTDSAFDHPCPKPERLILQLVGMSAEGQTILDPFVGSGTTAVAAKKLGRHFLGFEISPEYCRIAEERIALVEAKPTLFEKLPEQLQLDPC